MPIPVHGDHAGISQMKHHPDFYFKDGTVSFVVENIVFRLHRHFFERESDYFKQRLFLLGEGNSENGSIDNPFIIHDVKSDDFAQLVWVWYNPQYTYSQQSKDQWLTILNLATIWSFEGIRKLAIRQLEKLDLPPIEKISTYKRFGVDHKLLLTSYMALCTRESLPSVDEGKILGVETVLQLAAAREQSLVSASASRCTSPASGTIPNDVLESIVSEKFHLGVTNNANKSANSSTATETVVVKQPNPTKTRKEAQTHRDDQRAAESSQSAETKTGEPNNATNGATSHKVSYISF